MSDIGYVVLRFNDVRDEWMVDSYYATFGGDIYRSREKAEQHLEARRHVRDIKFALGEVRLIEEPQ